jgi:hypothetical protein
VDSSVNISIFGQPKLLKHLRNHTKFVHQSKEGSRVKKSETEKWISSMEQLPMLPTPLKFVGDILNLIATVSKCVYISHSEQSVWGEKGWKTNGGPSLSSTEHLKQGSEGKNKLHPEALFTKITSWNF